MITKYTCVTEDTPPPCVLLSVCVASLFAYHGLLLHSMFHPFSCGAGAVELELCKRLKAIADADKTLDQYGIRRFAEAFDVVPRTLAENSGKWVAAVWVCALWVSRWLSVWYGPRSGR
jgi:hypothetical protein